METMCADDLLSVLLYLLVKTEIPNWYVTTLAVQSSIILYIMVQWGQMFLVIAYPKSKRGNVIQKTSQINSKDVTEFRTYSEFKCCLF